MADSDETTFVVERVKDRTIIKLRSAFASADEAANRLLLAEASADAPARLRSGPDCWFLVSETQAAQAIIERCDSVLLGLLYSAVDYSASFLTIRIVGPIVEEVLAMGSGVDFRMRSFTVGHCCRTRLAKIAVIAVRRAECEFDILVDNSYERYMIAWLERSVALAERSAARS